MAEIYRFQEHDLVIEGEKHDPISLAEYLRYAEGTLGDIRYQMEKEFHIDGLGYSDEEDAHVE